MRCRTGGRFDGPEREQDTDRGFPIPDMERAAAAAVPGVGPHRLDALLLNRGAAAIRRRARARARACGRHADRQARDQHGDNGDAQLGRRHANGADPPDAICKLMRGRESATGASAPAAVLGGHRRATCIT